MGFLSWIGGIILGFWVLGLIFSVGGIMIHWLLLIAAMVFIVSMVSGKKRRRNFTK
jgi:predicted metal-binding membrane protein